MNLVIDSGNSAAKIGIFDHQRLVEKITVNHDSLEKFLSSRNEEHVIVSSVRGDSEKIASWINHKNVVILKHTLPLPIENLYETPATLGVDRLAGVCGAQQSFPSQNCLVIDAGTCITYDFLSRDGKYFGGGISPGLSMRFQAVHTFTVKLPLVASQENIELIGSNTVKSIQSGVVHGMIAEIDGIIQQYESKFPELKVILCGGDTPFFENKLKAAIFASPELVLIGLNSILNYNVSS